MSKQSSVDFIIKEFSDILGQLKTQPIQDLLLLDAVQKAKEMHKEEIVEHHTWLLSGVMNEESARKDGEDYYNQKYEQ